MEVLLGICGKDFVLCAADATSARSIVVMKTGEDKTRPLSKHSLLLYTGEPGDAVQFSEFIQRNLKLTELTMGIPLSVSAAASFTRRELAESLRSRNAYQVNLLIAGVDPKTFKPELYWLDYLASSVKLSFAAHGYASYFCMSTMDRYWHPEMTLEEAIALLKKCMLELRTRFVGNFPKFTVKVIDKEGIRPIEVTI